MMTLMDKGNYWVAGDKGWEGKGGWEDECAAG